MGGHIKVPDNIFRKCEICGDTFHPNTYRQKACGKKKIKTCPVCGKQFEYLCKPDYIKITCSKKCADIFAENIRNEKAEKIVRKCAYCGKEFTPKTKKDIYCSGPHYKKCEVCGKEFEFDVRGYSNIKTCSKECRYKSASRNKDIESMIRNHKKTMIEKYGVDQPMHIPGVVEKIKETNREKYGSDWYTQTDEYKQSVEETSLSRYGVKHFLSSEDVKNKRRDTCKEKYGFNNYAFLMVDHPEKLEKWIEFRKDGKKYISDNYSEKPTRNQLSEDLGVSYSTISQEIRLKGLDDYVMCNVSYMEDEIVEEIRKLIPSIQIIRRCKNVITPYELDIYLPEYKVAIECNPTYTHNSSTSSFTNKPKPIRYHQMKTEMCEREGVFLFHVFGYEWYRRKEIILSMIGNILVCNRNKIYARKCKLIEVSSNESRSFLEGNHRQGEASASIKLGLTYNDELVSLMTFGKLRGTIGTDKSDTSNCWELVRFCSKLDTNVVGGASKLFKYFVDNYSPEEIRSFSDRAHTKGNLYYKLGFHELRRSDPGYVWVELATDNPVNRVTVQKYNIKSFLHDDSIDLSLSESEIMIQHGFVKVFDSGTITWQWNKQQSLK